MDRFRVTYDIVTEESAEKGDFEESGFAAPGGWKSPADDPGPHEMSLREAIGITGKGLEDGGRSFYTSDSQTDYRTGAETSYAIHPPEGITKASYARLARLLTGRRR